MSISPNSLNIVNGVAVTRVDDIYSTAQYLGLDVQILNVNGYINGTKLCQLVGKRLDNFMRNNQTKALITELKPISPGGESFITVLSGNMDFRGTYMHRYLIAYLASWISPRFHIKVCGIADEVAIYRSQSSSLARQMRTTTNTAEIKTLTDQIAVLQQTLLVNIDESAEREEKLTATINHQQAELRSTEESLTTATGKLVEMVEHRVQPLTKEQSVSNDSFAILHNTASNMYRIFCRIRCDIDRAIRVFIAREKTLGRNYVVVYHMNYLPNGFNFKKRIQDAVAYVAECKFSDIYLKSITHREFMVIMDRIDAERKSI